MIVIPGRRAATNSESSTFSPPLFLDSGFALKRAPE
jgi:hypothetical protein